MERREAQPLTGRVPSHGARRARSRGSAKGVSQTPGASRRSIPLWGNGKREHRRPRAVKNRGDDARPKFMRNANGDFNFFVWH